MSQLLEDLIWLREFLTPETWIRGGMAYDSRDEINRKLADVTSDEAKCFCITGAIGRRIPPTAEEIAREKSYRGDIQMEVNSIMYSPVIWADQRRRAILHALGFSLSRDSLIEKIKNFKEEVDDYYRKFSEEELHTYMEMTELWRWNDSTHLEAIHTELDAAIEREKARGSQ
jgi:hypothetical protein